MTATKPILPKRFGKSKRNSDTDSRTSFVTSTRVGTLHAATREDFYPGILLKENMKLSTPEDDIPVPSAPKMSPIELPKVPDYHYYLPGGVTPWTGYNHWCYSIGREVWK
ncbi:uncharacterized protein FOMMEDRAFT_150020 [Fomitiporia mediterranea MF3/22]|uniref:uncharacterized protein n=1 Tax=Fomitiporia mediterranea (strain MF3/22) TaxID=694068 RepID=UPI000440933A|nr:uncharacterized protein FOMMEDRAFT_150020 [Fomitiporia mediterranea MF3/22]EJD07488.1 hypothetical protein FOMMEDRAFT_150020 [Fomitiporia mediterranea MF3/22]